MKTLNHLIQITMVISIFFFSACSGKHSSTESPISPDVIPGNAPEIALSGMGSHSMVAVYDACIDPESGTFTIEPSQRFGAFHFPLTNMFPNVLKITGYSFGPPFTASIKLTHPYPTSSIVGYDPRVIACLPANPGVSLTFPSHQVSMNNSVLLEPDGYTKLFDNTSLPGNVNPFMAYFTGKSYRQWGAATGTVETRTWVMDISGFGGPIQFKLIVDVSTNYPAPSTPITDNCLEPFNLEIDTHSSMTSSGGTAVVDVFVYDWQGKDSIGSVKAEAPDLFEGMMDLSFIANGPYAYSYYYSGTISNTNHAAAGSYDVLISTNDYTTGIQYFELTNVAVAPSPLNLVDLTPVHLNFSPQDIVVSEDYAYIAGGSNGLHVFYIGDPYDPFWVGCVRPAGFIKTLDVWDNTLYMVNTNFGIQIVDISDPYSPNIIGSAKLSSPGENILADSGYLYITTQNTNLSIFDIDPPTPARLIREIPMNDPQGMDISGAMGALFVADASNGLQIVDIAPPESAYILNTSHFTVDCIDVAIIPNMAFLATSNGTIQSYYLYDLTNPQLYSVFYTPGYPSSITILDEVGYVTESNAPFDPGALYTLNLGLHTDPIMSTVYTAGEANDIDLYGNFAYVADTFGGLYSVNAVDVQNLSIAAQVDSIGFAKKVHANSQYAYVADGVAGLRILDINPAGETSIIKTVDTPGYANDVCLLGDYAYVADGGEGLQIIDINPPTSSYIVKNVNTTGSSQGVYALAGTAYLAAGSAGVHILNVNPPESAYIMKTVDTPGQAIDVALGGLARLYVADYNNGVAVINISNISTAYISHTVSMSSMAEALTYMSGYVYVANNANGLQVINASTPDSAYIAKTVDTPGYALDVFLWDDIAYVADNQYGLAFVDISVPTSATYLDSYLTRGFSNGVYVYGSMVYVADGWGGLKILQSQ